MQCSCGAAPWRAALRIFGNTSEQIRADLPEGLFGSNVEGHEHLYGDAAAAVVEFLDTRDFAEKFAIDRTRLIRVGIGDEYAKAFFVFFVFGDEIDAVLRGVLGG